MPISFLLFHSKTGHLGDGTRHRRCLNFGILDLPNKVHSDCPDLSVCWVVSLSSNTSRYSSLFDPLTLEPCPSIRHYLHPSVCCFYEFFLKRLKGSYQKRVESTTVHHLNRMVFLKYFSSSRFRLKSEK